MIRFILNNQQIDTALPSGSTVLDFVRYQKTMKGTKIGCREGDCGACTVLVGDFENERLIYRAMTSCLMPLGNAHGKHIVTVEGVNLPAGKHMLPALSPVQKAMVDTNGTQCGFCTIGFIMSFAGFTLHPTAKKFDDAIAAIDGNICRCTGYKSIEKAAKLISEKLQDKPADNTVGWLIENNFLPEYFSSVEMRLKELRQDLPTAIPVSSDHKNVLKIGGGTDLLVQKPSAVKHSGTELLFDQKHLQHIYEKNDRVYLGGSVTVTAFSESEIIKKYFPDLRPHIKLVSSTPIRNMATIAGNIVNASPIGDMSVYLLALDAEVVLTKNGATRQVKLKEFYKGYKSLNKDADEIIGQIVFSPPAKHAFFSFEKVSKRTYLDIASVNTAALIRVEKQTLQQVHLSAGGVAPFPKYLSETASFLTGRSLDDLQLEKAIEIMQQEIAPISDARGTADYKRLLLRQLFLAHMTKAGGKMQVEKILLQ